MPSGREKRARGLPALTGIAHVLLLFVGSAAVAGTRGPGRHSLHASPEEAAAYAADAGLARVWVGEYVAVVAYLLFLPFAAYVWSALRARAAPGWLGGTMRGAASIYVALSVLAIAALLPVLNRELEPVQAAAFLDLRTAALSLAFLALATWLVAVGAAAARTAALPRWLAWSAVALGLLQVIATPFAAFSDEVTGLPTFAAFLWIAVVSVLLARRPAPA